MLHQKSYQASLTNNKIVMHVDGQKHQQKLKIIMGFRDVVYLKV